MDDFYNPAGKFHRLSTGDLPLPAQCGGCGKIDDPDGFVDTALNFDFYGALHFCNTCAFEMTTVFPEAPYHTMRTRILQLENEIIAKDAKIASLERGLDGITAARLSERGVTIADGVAAVLTVEESNDSSPSDVSDGAFIESVLAEPVKDDRPVQPRKSQRRDPIITDV